MAGEIVLVFDPPVVHVIGEPKLNVDTLHTNLDVDTVQVELTAQQQTINLDATSESADL